MNDSFRTDVFVRWQPETIACACIYLAARQLQVSLVFDEIFFFQMRVDKVSNHISDFKVKSNS